jgi:hypothetical protein
MPDQPAQQDAQVSGDDHNGTGEARPHEFDEDVNDGSMCMCGVPALYHHLAEPEESS